MGCLILGLLERYPLEMFSSINGGLEGYIYVIFLT